MRYFILVCIHVLIPFLIYAQPVAPTAFIEKVRQSPDYQALDVEIRSYNQLINKFNEELSQLNRYADLDEISNLQHGKTQLQSIIKELEIVRDYPLSGQGLNTIGQRIQNLKTDTIAWKNADRLLDHIIINGGVTPQDPIITDTVRGVLGIRETQELPSVLTHTQAARVRQALHRQLALLQGAEDGLMEIAKARGMVDSFDLVNKIEKRVEKIAINHPEITSYRRILNYINPARLLPEKNIVAKQTSSRGGFISLEKNTKQPTAKPERIPGMRQATPRSVKKIPAIKKTIISLAMPPALDLLIPSAAPFSAQGHSSGPPAIPEYDALLNEIRNNKKDLCKVMVEAHEKNINDEKRWQAEKAALLEEQASYQDGYLQYAAYISRKEEPQNTKEDMIKKGGKNQMKSQPELFGADAKYDLDAINREISALKKPSQDSIDAYQRYMDIQRGIVENDTVLAENKRQEDVLRKAEEYRQTQYGWASCFRAQEASNTISSTRQ